MIVLPYAENRAIVSSLCVIFYCFILSYNMPILVDDRFYRAALNADAV